MPFLSSVDRLKARAEFLLKRLSVVPSDRQSGAPLRSLGSKGGHDYVTAWSDSAAYLFDIPTAILRICEEMEDRAVVPHSEMRRWQIDLGDITRDPFNGRRW